MTDEREDTQTHFLRQADHERRVVAAGWAVALVAVALAWWWS